MMLYSSLEVERNKCPEPTSEDKLLPSTEYTIDDRLVCSQTFCKQTFVDWNAAADIHSIYMSSKSSLSSRSVTFDLGKNKIHRYEAYDDDDGTLERPLPSCSSLSWRRSIRADTYINVMACRQELAEAVENIIEWRGRVVSQRGDAFHVYGLYVEHLISAIAVRKNHVSTST